MPGLLAATGWHLQVPAEPNPRPASAGMLGPRHLMSGHCRDRSESTAIDGGAGLEGEARAAEGPPEALVVTDRHRAAACAIVLVLVNGAGADALVEAGRQRGRGTPMARYDGHR